MTVSRASVLIKDSLLYIYDICLLSKDTVKFRPWPITALTDDVVALAPLVRGSEINISF
jgi:hypothetical protein